jgi:glycosyltransferase involved in cell wall biosynthesis
MYHANIFALVPGLFRITPPVVWNIRHSLHDLRRERGLTRAVVRVGALASRFPARIVYNSGRSLEQHSAIGYRRDTAMVIPNGFDSERFKPDDSARERWRVELQVSRSAPAIGLIARFHPTKNHVMFIEVAARVAAEFPDLVVVLAGSGVDAGNRVLMEAIRSCGLAGRVKLLGEIADTVGLMNALDVVCLTSGGESFPNVLGEALLCGKPCVSTDVGEAPAIVGTDGAVVPVERADLFSDRVCRLLAMPDDERMNVAKSARERVLRKYGLAAVARQYGELYASVMAGARTSQ